MKAPVLFEQRAPLRVEELQGESPREGEVPVRMLASDLCHSCLHAADGSWQGIPLPIVLGDEGADEADQAFRDLAAGALARGLIVF